MYLIDFDNEAGEQLDPPQIIWDVDDRYAIIASLLLSVDKKPDAMDIKKLDVFMGISISHSDDEKEKKKLKELRDVRNAVIRECGVFLDCLDRDESYCDYVMNEINQIIVGNDDCAIGRGYSQGFLTAEPIELAGGAHFVFDYLKLIQNDSCYTENQKRLLKHLARKWKVDKSVLPVLEGSVISLNEINKKRAEIGTSDIPHREALSALSSLDEKEQAVWGNLNKLSITNERAIDAENYSVGKNIFSSIFNPSLKNANGKNEDDDTSEEYSFVDRVGDCIVDGIMKVGEIISTPFEWLSGVR
jgi:hypothetical protein